MCVALSNNQNRFISFFPSTASCFLRSAPGHPLTDLHSGRCSRKSAFSCFTDILGHASSDTPHRIDHLIRRNLAEDSRTRQIRRCQCIDCAHHISFHARHLYQTGNGSQASPNRFFKASAAAFAISFALPPDKCTTPPAAIADAEPISA